MKRRGLTKRNFFIYYLLKRGGFKPQFFGKMSYSDFDLKKVKAEFNLKIIETEDLFSQVEPVEISNLLAEMLKQNVPIALAIAT